jgi:hypothetical protein
VPSEIPNSIFSGTASAFPTITSPQTSMVNVGTAQAQADTPRPNSNEPNA